MDKSPKRQLVVVNQSNDDLEAQQNHCKDFKINLSIDNAFHSSFHLNDNIRIELEKFIPSTPPTVEPSKRNCVLLTNKKHQKQVPVRKSFRLNNSLEEQKVEILKSSSSIMHQSDALMNIEISEKVGSNNDLKIMNLNDSQTTQVEDHGKKQDENIDETNSKTIHIHEIKNDTIIIGQLTTSSINGSEKNDSPETDILSALQCKVSCSTDDCTNLLSGKEFQSDISQIKTELTESSALVEYKTNSQKTDRKMAEILRQLNTTLSPKMTVISNNDQDKLKVSRFGRHQKNKSGFEDYIPVEVTRFIRSSPMKTKNSKAISSQDNEKCSSLATKFETLFSKEEQKTTALKIEMEIPNEELNLNSDEPILSDSDSARGSSVDDFVTKYKNGDILWGSIGNSVFWPCMVCPDPNDQTVTSKNFIKVHVRFFSDNGRRSWLKAQKTIEFTGIEDLETNILHANQDKKQKRWPTVSQRAAWKSAIIQAQDFKNLNQQDRYPGFLELLEKERLIRFEQSKQKRLSSSTAMTAKNLHQFESQYRKRSRSSSPDSPLFEELTAEGIKQEVEQDKIDRFFKSIETEERLRQPPKKKIRLENEKMIVKKEIDSDEIDNDLSFQQFFESIKSTVLTSNSTELVDELKMYAKKIWLIKIMDSNPHTTHSDRLKNFGIHLNRKLSLRHRSDRSSTTTTESLAMSKHIITSDDVGDEKPVKPIKNKKEVFTLKEMFLSKLDKNYLFKGMTREPICPICKKTGDLVKCQGECGDHWHVACVKQEFSNVSNSIANIEPIEVKLEPNETGIFKCNECSGKNPRKCFVCRKTFDLVGTKQKIKCNVNNCGKFYHISCLQQFPQTIIEETSLDVKLFCSQHCCHTCVSDDPKQKTKQKENKPPLIKCIACPSSYHFDSGCVPAGSEFFTATQILCPKHSVEMDRKNFINVNWCFICSLGGTLLCCELCPTSFHLECLDIQNPPSGRYICDECESGRLPLYNEIVWAKYSHHRWWPAMILPPPVIPEIMLKKKHLPFEFCIRFFGSHDFCWIKRERVFLYQDGDSNFAKKSNKAAFNQGVAEAKEIFDYLQEQKKNEINDPSRFDTRPPFYTRILCNRPIPSVKINQSEECAFIDDICNCKPTDEEPCGRESNCINRTLSQECDQATCPSGLLCRNQQFKNRCYPKLKVYRTPGRGWGLKTLEEIKTGCFVIEYVGELIDNAELERRLKKKAEQNDDNYYFLTIHPNLIIDAGPKGNLSRFMNHSCDPNCRTEKWTVGGKTRVGLFALHDIQPNTELTFNYNLEAVGAHKKICRCGAKSCTGFIGALKNDSKKSKGNKQKQKMYLDKLDANKYQLSDGYSDQKLLKREHITGDSPMIVN